MSIFAIADLHLSLAKPKEMDIFGEKWARHFEKIKADWENRVGEEDTVLIPGDISWAMKLEDAQADLDAIGALPGKKILLKGNHDYWWGSLNKINAVLKNKTIALQNNCAEVGDFVVCGTRGWTFDNLSTESDSKIYEREKLRLALSLEAAKKYSAQKIIVMMHYPPIYQDMFETGFTQIIEQYPVEQVVFGHLHGDILNHINLTDIMVKNIKYNLVSADYLDFKLKKII
ncbi:MAG: metallophosphoesterase [Christensenellaceae bacterium]